MMTAIPSSAESRRTSVSISSRPAGSSPFVGSSRMTRLGEWTIAWARFVRWLHADRERADEARALLLEPHLEEHLRRAQDGHPPREAAQLAHVDDEVARGHAHREAHVLGHVPEQSPDLARLVGGVHPEHPHLARLGRDQPEHRLHERRLAGAVRAEQAERGARHGGRHVVEGRHMPEPLRHACGLDQRLLGSRHAHHGRRAGAAEVVVPTAEHRAWRTPWGPGPVRGLAPVVTRRSGTPGVRPRIGRRHTRVTIPSQTAVDGGRRARRFVTRERRTRNAVRCGV